MNKTGNEENPHWRTDGSAWIFRKWQGLDRELDKCTVTTSGAATDDVIGRVSGTVLGTQSVCIKHLFPPPSKSFIYKKITVRKEKCVIYILL